MRKLSAPELYRFTQINSEEFHVSESDTKEFMQRFHPRAFQSLNFGLHLKRNQNHIFIMGEPGVGRIGMTKSMLREAAKRKDIPQDVGLVSDFSEANKTQYGTGSQTTFQSVGSVGFKMLPQVAGGMAFMGKTGGMKKSGGQVPTYGLEVHLLSQEEKLLLGRHPAQPLQEVEHIVAHPGAQRRHGGHRRRRRLHGRGHVGGGPGTATRWQVRAHVEPPAAADPRRP